MKKHWKTPWSCDGTETNDYDGHPRVYLLESENCPYCGRLSLTNAIREGLIGIEEDNIVNIDDETDNTQTSYSTKI